MTGRRRTGLTAAMACLLIVGGAALFGSTSAAQVTRPVIFGDAVIDGVLTASDSATGRTIYQWQGCNPDVADCSDSLSQVDPNWVDLTGQSHELTSFTIPASAAGYFIRVVTHDNTTGAKWITSAPVGPVPQPPAPPQTTTTAAPDQTVEPEHGISLLVQPTEGNVQIKLPGQSGFSPLQGLEKIPVNSVLDTRGGKARVTAATGDLGDTTADQSVEFYAGLIRIQQSAATNAPTIAKLIQKLKCSKKAKSARASTAGGPIAVESKRRSSGVWGSGHGNYGSRGSGGTGSVRGTTWFTKNTCKGTFFKVTEGIGISVFDFDLGKTLELGPGQSYFARNR